MLSKIIVRAIAVAFLLSILTAASLGNSPTVDWSSTSCENTVTDAYSLLSKAKEYPLNIVSSSAIDYSGLPKIDEILYKAYPGAIPDTIVDEFLLEITDWIEGPGRIDLYDNVVAAGEKVSPFESLPHFTFIAINCRDYKETLETENFPLNDSNFRLALSYIYGADRKQNDISNYIQEPWIHAIGNPVPPAQKPWYNETIQMPDTDWDTAWNILQTAGYYVNTTDNCLYRDNAGLRNLTVWHSTCASWSLVLEGFAGAFNEFVAYIGAEGPTMTVVPISFQTLVYQLLVHHDYDFIGGIGYMNMGRYVDWLYDCLHSDNKYIIYGGNFPGISDPLLDEWTTNIKTGLDINNVIGNASLVQERFVHELVPWIPMSNNAVFSTTARDARGELVNIVSMPNFGPINDWSFMTAHWKDSTGGTVKVALNDNWHTMNPYNEDTVYGWRILDRAITGLLSVGPNTLQNMPFVATDWSATPLVSIPELGITEGCMITFYLRQDVYWHDGKQVTAYDCVNNLNLIRKYKPGEWASLAWADSEGPYKFNAYFFTPSLYWVDKVAEAALLSPKHITDAAEALYGSILTGWDPAFNTYEDLMGVDPPSEYPFMKQIVGCGPFVYDYADPPTMTARVQKYEEYFVKAPVIGAVVGDWWIGDIRTVGGWPSSPPPAYPYTYKVLAQNIAAQANSSDSELVSVTVDVKVYEDNVLMHTESGVVLDPWSYTYLGPYTTDPVIGLHEIKVEVVESGNVIHTYIHKYVAVVRQDITSYSGDFVDCFVDVKDLLRAAIAYGSYPGSSKWDAACDINDDYFVGIKDILSTVFVYGWHV